MESGRQGGVFGYREDRVHMIAHGSAVKKRVVRSRRKAETYQLSDVVQATALSRASIANAHGLMDHFKV